MSLISLDGFAGGALLEKFNMELQKVLENMSDPNTDPTAKRKIQINLTFESNENRNVSDVEIQAKTTLAPSVAVGTSVLFDQDERGKVVGKELKSGIPGQTFFDPEDGELKQDDGEILDFRKSKSNK